LLLCFLDFLGLGIASIIVINFLNKNILFCNSLCNKFGMNENYCYIGLCIIFGKCTDRCFRDLRTCQKYSCIGPYFAQDMMNIIVCFHCIQVFCLFSVSFPWSNSRKR
jgi:hypothetical protein